ncbi:MAG: enoyl-CoA hydratase/isomerase family protein [Halieaceae bacterium]|nr:enoyl-CoA hydratase/isomerase family protein [Halieaceae bacterium]
MDEQQHILFSIKGHVATLTLNRPDTLNAIDEDMHQELLETLLGIRGNHEIRAVLLAASGKAFSAGGDLNEIRSLHLDAGKRNRMADIGIRLIEALMEIPVPVVVALHGHAIGLGASIALSSDIIVASRNAKLADTHVKVGLVAGDGGCLIWPMSMGFNRAKRYLLTGKMLPAEQAYEFGLVTDLVESPEEVLPLAAGIAEELAALSPLAVQGTKKALNQLAKARANEVFPLGMAYESLSIGSSDVLEALAGFQEKRKPEFKGY